jgi:hypothetical protein
MDRVTWNDNKSLMVKLWPRWKPDEALAALLNARWSHLRQDKLRECIENHRFERDSSPDVSAIQAAYARVTQGDRDASVGEAEVQRTRAQQPEAITPAEGDAWDRHVERVLATATADEIARCRERLPWLTLSNRRMLGLAVEYCRLHPKLISLID